MRIKACAGCVSLILLFMVWPTRAQEQPRVTAFSPQGIVKRVRQVRARFSDPMVTFGDLRAQQPFDITCREGGTARWVDERNWVYDFDQFLPAGTRCEFRVREGLKTLAGRDVAGQRGFVLSTGGPAVIRSIPYEGSEQIDEEQIFILELDGEATDASVLANVWFSVTGIADRIGVRIVSGKEREDIIKAALPYRRDAAPHLLLVQSKQRFPESTRVNLVWGKGVAAPTGVTGESDRILPFVTRRPFTATFECARENPDAHCVPISPMRVAFSVPLPWEVVKAAVITGPGGRSWAPEPPSKEYEDKYVPGVTFKGPFPERSEFTVRIPEGIKDDSGRPLANARSFPLTVRTDEYPPLAKFSADFGIIELKADPMLPVTLRNVEPQVAARMLTVDGSSPVTERPAQPGEVDVQGNLQGKVVKVPSDKASQMLFWIDKVQRRSWQDRDKSVLGPAETARARGFSIPKLQGPKAFEVVGIPMKSPGFYVVEIQSEILGAALLGRSKPMYIPTTALVTNLSVHFKWGIDSSLVWVTTLDKGKPVAEAAVQVQDCEGKIAWEGKTDRDGIARTDSLPRQDALARCSNSTFGSGLLVTARLAEDFSFVHSSWSEGIEPWRFQLPTDYEYRPALAHTVLDRSLFRAGETVHMKHVLRRQVTGGLALVPAAKNPKSVVITHLGSDQKYEIPVNWDSNGIAETTWAIPKDAKLGMYAIYMPMSAPRPVWMRAPAPEEYTQLVDCGSFRVEEFRIPLMKAVIRPPSNALVAPADMPVDIAVTYLGGGGAGSLPVKLRSQIMSRPVFFFDKFDGFLFSNGKIKEGVSAGSPYELQQPQPYPVKSTDLTLDKLGTARSVITELPKADKPLEVLAELEYKDPNGETGTVSTRIPFWPSNRLVGIKPFSWGLTRQSVKFQVAVVDLRGNPAAGSPVKVDLLERNFYSHRKRLVGGFYAYENSTEVKRVRTICEGKTDQRGLLFCDQPSPVSGNVILEAIARDEAGRETSAWQDVWVAGDRDWWFEARDDDRIDLIPEKKRYEPGEKARFQVRMPFRAATALVTFEREGVGDAYVKELSGKEPVIEIPVKGNYAPNIFVSVLVVRGRVTGVQPTATVDLGRPAYKLGISEINVGWRAHELKVAVNADRPVYKVREKAKVTISVKTPDGKPPAPGGEVAVAAVDEGLLELTANTSWQLLNAMMGRRSYSVQTSTAQMHVVGKRHFGLKALPSGGGGGTQITRELFDTLLLWKGRVPLNAQGQASVEVPLNDSITSFRIVAVANQGLDHFGTGSTSIRATQDVMIFSGISPVVREGDKVASEFTFRNATERAMRVQVSAGVKELKQQLAPMSVDLAPGEAKEASWSVTVPAGVGTLTYEVEGRESETNVDRLRVVQKVVPAIPVRTFQATLEQIAGSMNMNVRMPEDGVPGRGGVRVTLKPTLAGSMQGVTEYMQQYPYTCLEQEVSRAVALRDSTLWNRTMAQLPSYLDADGLAKYFPQMLTGSDTLTSYILAIAHEAGWAIPPDLKQRMTAALRGFVEGRIVRYSSLPTADVSIRKIAAVEALSRNEKVDPALLSSITIDPNLWPTSAVIDWFNILKAVPAIRNRDTRQREADQILRSRLLFQGTTMGFSSERSDWLWWLMVSPDTNGVRLLLSELTAPDWKQDMPRLVRGALGRQRRGRWDTTVANAWGVLAMEKYAKAFESAPLTGITRVALAGKTQSLDWGGAPSGTSFSFDWPPQAGNLAITMAGTGSPYATVQSMAAIPLKQPLSAGYKITKTLTAIEQKESGVWTKGDIVRVRLDLESTGDMTWVVIDDPIPAGATVFGTGLGRDSAIATEGEKRKGRVWPAFEERSFEAFRSYYEYVPRGKWTVEYTIRLNSRGIVNLPPTRAEALYSPEMFGEIPNAPMEIK